MKKTGLFVLVACAAAQAQQAIAPSVCYKSVCLGEKVSDLPEVFGADNQYVEGNYRGTWFELDVFGGKVNGIDVIYVGKTLYYSKSKTTISQEITLAEAIKEHSLQPGKIPPTFGYAIDRDGVTYGLVDVQNRISYFVTPLTPGTMVEQVDYLRDSAPVVETAKHRLLESPKAMALLSAARLNDHLKTGHI